MSVRHAVRGLRREPIFSVAAIATFALGIGAATAIFSIAYGIAFRPLPYPNGERLVRIYEANTATNESKLPISEGTFQSWRDTVTSLENIALFTPVRVRHTPGDRPQPIAMIGVSPRFFDVLGATPLYGRTFNDESQYGRGKVDELVVSYHAWQRLLGGDPNIVGRPVEFVDGDDPFVIVGIMPPTFAFDMPVDAWRPIAMPMPIPRGARAERDDRAVGRLRPDRTIDHLRAELDIASAQLAREFPASNAGWTATVEPLRDAMIGRFSRASWVFMGAVIAVLLAACANVAGLLSARAFGRARETSIRVALGARRWRVAQLWLIEAGILSAAGAGLGVTMAWWLVYLLRAAAPPGLPRVEEIAVDLPALGFACAATIAAALICTAVPLMGARDRALTDALKTGSGHAGHHPGRRRIGTALVVFQCGAAFALVVVAVVFGRSFLNLTAVDLGWRPERVLSLYLAPRWPAEIRRPWFLYATWAERLVERLEATPGIARAAVTTAIPFSPDMFPADIARGRDRMLEETRWPISLHMVTTGYFDTMGLTRRRGRLFTPSDRFDEAALTARAKAGGGVAIVSESLAQTLWPGQEAIGQLFRLPSFGQGSFQEVVGVVADVHFTTVGAEPTLDVFLPWLQMPTGRPRLVVRATVDAAAIAPVVRDAVVAEHARTGIDRVTVVANLVDRAMAPARITTQLISALGVLALVLAGVGVYGALSMLVNARAREIAVRMALGASPAQTMSRTLVQGLVPVIVGVVAGAGGAMAFVASARSLLFGIDRVDGPSLMIGGGIVFAVTIVGCLAPALRAARTDPLGLLRAD